MIRFIKSNNRCSYCTGSIYPSQCESCDALSGDCFVGLEVYIVEESKNGKKET